MCSECRQTPCHPRCPNNDDKPVAYCDNCGIELYDSDRRCYVKNACYCMECVTITEGDEDYVEF